MEDTSGRSQPLRAARFWLANMRITDWPKRHAVVTFFVLSYAIAWPGWWLEARGAGVGTFLLYFGPAIAAVVTAAITGGKAALEEVLARLFRWRVSLKWYLAAALLPAAAALAVFLSLAFANNSTDFNPAQLQPVLPSLGFLLVTATLFGTFVASGEEIGWRGFALPRLLQKHHPLVATLVVGIFWGLWHLPLSFVGPGGPPKFVDALIYGLGVDIAAVIYTWLFIHTKGSVLICSLFHSAFDVWLVVSGQVAQAMPGLEFSWQWYVLVWAIIAGAVITLDWRTLGARQNPAHIDGR